MWVQQCLKRIRNKTRVHVAPRYKEVSFFISRREISRKSETAAEAILPLWRQTGGKVSPSCHAKIRAIRSVQFLPMCDDACRFFLPRAGHRSPLEETSGLKKVRAFHDCALLLVLLLLMMMVMTMMVSMLMMMMMMMIICASALSLTREGRK